MQDLKSRLKKEMCRDFEGMKKVYPTTLKNIMDALENEEFIVNLKYDTILNIEYYLFDYSKVGKPFDVFEMFEKYKD
jgi:hypothetical protein